MYPLRIIVPALLCLLIILPACAQRTMTPTERAQYSTHLAPQASTAAVLDAVADIFFLAHPNAFDIQRTDTSLIAQRRYGLEVGVSLAQSTDTWTIQTQPQANGTHVTLTLENHETWINQTPTVTVPDGPAVYEQFWHRLDYLLGARPDWMSCRGLKRAYLEDTTWGEVWWLCESMTDRKPPQTIKGEWVKKDLTPLSEADHAACTHDVEAGAYGPTATPLQHQAYLFDCYDKKGYKPLTEKAKARMSSHRPATPPEPFHQRG